MTEYLLERALLKHAPKQRTQSSSGIFDAFLSHCHRRRYPARAEVFRPGDPASTLYYVVSGSLSVIAEDDSGQELLLSYINPGDFVGEMGLYIQSSRREVLLRTRVATELAEIAYDRLASLLVGPLAKDCSPLLFAINEQIARRLLQSNRKAHRLAFMDVSNRIARALIDLSREPDALPHPQGRLIRISRQELARVAGCSREMVTRAMKRFQQEGLLLSDGRSVVLFDAK